MDNDEPKDQGDTNFSVDTSDTSCSAVSKQILDYYKKFGRKRDIEQFFSLSTAQQDLSEPSSLFWKRMKEQNDSSDSGDKKTGSSMEVCRISIKCSMEDPQTSKEYNKNTDSDTESPPIISDDVPDRCLDSGDESNKSEGEHSHKSIDMTLDTSLNRAPSPTSSVTSQRKLEWDSLADVGYGNESDRKNSASSLSTLERLALHQQYSNNDTKPNSELGAPTAHSTPLDQTESKSKVKKDGYKKISKFCKKDVDIMEVNFPNTSDNTNQPINVNLTKHISFNVEKDGAVKMDNLTKKISVSRDNLTSDASKDNVDKEIQTTLPRNSKDNIVSTKDHSSRPRFPILINLNTIKNRKKKRKRKLSRPRKRGMIGKENVPQEKSINQESDAESFEYMPGHMYNQKKLENKSSVLSVADNKSSLESSAGHTTESSKDFKCTFTNELEKSIHLLKLALQHRYKDTSLKQKLIQEVVQSLVQTKYKSDESSNELMYALNQNNPTPSSTSGSNKAENKPKKSILRAEKFDPGELATTSQSAPNLPIISTEANPEIPLKPVNLSSTDTDLSYKSKYLSEVFLANSSSEEIYKKYLIALKKENMYKKKLKEQELLLRQKLKPNNQDILDHVREKSTLDRLMKDLAKNNVADGSGDASNACPSSSNVENGSEQQSKSRSVFTLSAGNNDLKKNKKLRSRLESEINNSIEAGSSSRCQGCSAYRREKIVVTDSSVQVNFSTQHTTESNNMVHELNIPFSNEKIRFENSQEDIKYVCLCTETPNEVPDNFLIYKCSRMPSQCIMVGSNNNMNSMTHQKAENFNLVYTDACESKDLLRKSTTSSQSSQTHFNIPKLTLDNCCPKVKSSSSTECRSSNDATESKIASMQRASFKTCKGARLTQTEISIDPKISDPSISDLKIFENEVYTDINTDCYVAYKENNEICKDAKYSCTENKPEDVMCKLSSKEKGMVKPANNKKPEESDCNVISLQNLQAQSNFTIPIHGTNMTLKVSVGSRDSQEIIAKDAKANEQFRKADNDYFSLQTDTLKPKRTECVSVQTSLEGERDNDDLKVCYAEVKDGQRPTTSAYKYDSVDMGYYNTYPKETLLKKPLLRSNTDTGKMELFNPSPHINIRDVDAKGKTPKNSLPKSSRVTRKEVDQKESSPISNTGANKIEFVDRSTSMNAKDEDIKGQPVEKRLLNLHIGSDKKKHINRFTSMETPAESTFKKPLPKSNIEPSNKESASHALKDTEDNLKDATPRKPLLKPNLDTDNQNTFDRHTSMGQKHIYVEEKLPTKHILRSDALEKEYIDRHTSMSLENENKKEQTVKEDSNGFKNDSDKKQFINRPSSYSKGNDDLKEHSLNKPLMQSRNDNVKEFHDRYTSMGKESKHPKEASFKHNTDILNLNTNVYINRKDVDTQCDPYLTTQTEIMNNAPEVTDGIKYNSNDIKGYQQKISRKMSEKTHSSSATDDSKNSTQDPLLDIIRDITKRYSKKEADKSKRKKCYAEIIAVLNYLLDTGETTENESNKVHSSTNDEATRVDRSPRRFKSDKAKKTLQKDVTVNACAFNAKTDSPKKTYKDKSVQPSPRKSKQNKCCGESTDCPVSTDIHSTSTDSTACKTHHKYKHVCDKHQCCASHRKCDMSSSSSVNCDTCKHRCHCRGHRGHRRPSERNKKYVAYNLILQTSDSVASEDIDRQKVERHLKEIVVKVPSKRRVQNMQFKEVTQKIERDLPRDQFVKDYRARSPPQDTEVSSTDNLVRNMATCTIRDYLEQNRPDFVERSSRRQNCLKSINEARPHECDKHLNMIVVHPPTRVRNKVTSMYCEGVIDDMGCPCDECYHKLYCVQNEVTRVASDRAAKREVLSAHVDRAVASDPGDIDLRRLAEAMGKDLRSRKMAPKFISEKEMKKHSEKIYKSLPEVQRKKDEIRKERIKKTNLLMANIFKKNLQKKTLRGAVNLSNYSAVIKI